MRKLIILLILVFYAYPIEASALSLQDILRLALANNNQIKEARYLIKKAEYNFKSQVASVMPQISLSGRVSKTNGEELYHSIGIKLNQPIDINGRISLALKFAWLQVKIAENNLKELKRNILYNVKSAYYKVLLDRRLIEVERLRLDSLKRHYNMVRDKYKKGLTSRYDLIRAKVDLKNAHPDYISTKNSLTSDINQLQLLIGEKIEERKIIGSLQYTTRKLPPLEHAIKAALKQRPDLKIAEINEQLAEISLNLKKKENLPELSFSANFLAHSSLAKENHDFTLSLNLTFPIYDCGKNKYDIESQKAYLNSIRESKRYLVKKIKKEVTDAYNDIATAKGRIKAIEGNVKQAKLGLKIASTRYKEGLATYLDLIDSELALHTARVNMARSIYSYLLSIEHLKLVEGE